MLYTTPLEERWLLHCRLTTEKKSRKNFSIFILCRIDPIVSYNDCVIPFERARLGTYRLCVKLSKLYSTPRLAAVWSLSLRRFEQDWGGMLTVRSAFKSSSYLFRVLRFSWLLEWLRGARRTVTRTLWSPFRRCLSSQIGSNPQVRASCAQTRLHRVCTSTRRDVLWWATSRNWLPEIRDIKEMSRWFRWLLC